VDPTISLLNLAEKERRSPDVDYRVYRDGVVPLEDGEVDAVWCCMVLSTVLDEAMLAHTVGELRRVLRSGGLMFLVDNTAGPAHRPVVRSPYSMSRTVEEYTRAFASWVQLREVGAYVDLGETNSVLQGYAR
jgi:SAM-dependent methyltransferase